MTYGADVYRFYSLPPEELLLEDARNPMCEAFPRVNWKPFEIKSLQLQFIRLPVAHITSMAPGANKVH